TNRTYLCEVFHFQATCCSQFSVGYYHSCYLSSFLIAIITFSPVNYYTKAFYTFQFVVLRGNLRKMLLKKRRWHPKKTLLDKNILLKSRKEKRLNNNPRNRRSLKRLSLKQEA